MKTVKKNKIVALKSLGQQKTIDLEVNHPDHNFYCNDVVVSNSHSIAYSTLAMKTVAMKFSYPLQFFSALLRNSKYEQDPFEIIDKISKELPFFGIQLLRPDLSKSQIDFSIEDKNIRYGLSSIKGIKDKQKEALLELVNYDRMNKFDIFLAAKQSKINIGVLSGLIQAGALEAKNDNRAYLVYEAQIFNILTEREKRNFVALGPKYDYDLFQIWKKEILEGPNIADDGKTLVNEKRQQTIKTKAAKYREIYLKNSKNKEFANWFFERKLLGYSYTSRLKDIFNKHGFLVGLEEFKDESVGAVVNTIAVISDVYRGRTKKDNRKYARIEISDEKENLTIFIWDDILEDIEKKKELQKESIVTLRIEKTQKGYNLKDLKNINDTIYIKLSDVK